MIYRCIGIEDLIPDRTRRLTQLSMEVVSKEFVVHRGGTGGITIHGAPGWRRPDPQGKVIGVRSRMCKCLLAIIDLTHVNFGRKRLDKVGTFLNWKCSWRMPCKVR